MRIASIQTILLLVSLVLYSGADAQQLRKAAETDRYTEYTFSNDSLKAVHAHDFLIDGSLSESYEVITQHLVTKRFSSDSQSLIQSFSLSPDQTPLFEVTNAGIYRGQQKANLLFHAVRYSESNPEEMIVVKNARFRIYKTPRTNQRPIVSQMQLAQDTSTPLSDGEWYKIPVSEKGIYALGSDYLIELGITVEQLNPENIQIWTTPGGELPRLNAAERPQLAQIPILVEGEADGSFDESDRVIFYADSPHQEFRDTESNSFSHQLHRYSENNYVFLRIDGSEESLRQETTDVTGTGPVITEFRDFRWIEEELAKSEPTIRSGLEWYGMRLSNSAGQRQRTIFDDTIPGLISGRTMDIDIRFIGRSTQSMGMSFSYGNENLGSSSVLPINNYRSEEGISGRSRTLRAAATVQDSEQIQLTGQLNASDPTSEGMIDWIRLSYDRQLITDNDYLYVYSPGNVTGQVATYELRGFTAQPLVMEVSDPLQPELLDVSGTAAEISFSYNHTEDNRFIAQASYFTPEPGERIPNQNLRGISINPDYVIVTSEFYTDLASEWADYRREKDGYEVAVVTQEQIFNEFSGATPDVTAIRDYIKFLYDLSMESGQEPLQNLLLFGDATYDYKNIVGGSLVNHVFTFQSDESLHRINSYGSDDYYGFLDDTEGEWLPNRSNERLDIGVGRFPVSTLAEARVLMNKIRTYESPETTGDWKTRFTFVSDDDFPDVQTNRDLHLLNADGTAQVIDVVESATKINKIHMLSYPVETSAAGRRVPGASNDMIRSFNEGSLIINYSGHGGQFVLADEQLFTTEMISRLKNRDRLSIFVTATCQFGRFDDTSARSGAEQTLLWAEGGIVSALTTTRVVYTSSTAGSNNFGLNIQLTRKMLERDENGLPLRLGNIYKNTKNTSQGSGFNARKFILLGDPAMRIGLPEQRTEITRINDVDLQQFPDSTLQIRALDTMSLAGQVTDSQGNYLPGFSGQTTITVFDSERVVSLPDRDWVQEGRCYTGDCKYTVENDILFNGRVSVENGRFNTEFIIPRDISFTPDNGRVLAYTSTNGTDGAGSVSNVIFNGINEDAPADSDGPTLDAYLNDRNFVNGNLVGSSSTLIVDLEDEAGINTTGTGVGHEIIATIDTNPRKTVVLNEFYQSNLDDFRKGRIEYPLDELPQGSYTLTVRAWDVYNNPEEATIHFEVADSDELKIRNVYNYPNPMSRNTRFIFEHNQPGNQLDISIRIYTLSGMPVTHLQESQITSNSYANIEWNGLDRDYDRLANGTYIYVLRVGTDTPEGKQTEEKIEKLVIIR
ncbi:type IX secretion system sortase PorU [Rhodohalobacter sp. 8-1]|uniref:type IX secretion system sortase PorU n=1 Tax=Rhodohalobacter sp. 8-1 TaxID=3131972 RepID=UPI0030EB64E6